MNHNDHTGEQPSSALIKAARAANGLPCLQMASKYVVCGEMYGDTVALCRNCETVRRLLMAEPTDSLEHEARKDRTTYAAAVLLASVNEWDSESITAAVETALKLEREVSHKLDEELRRGKK